MADDATDATAHIRQDFGKLCGLAGTRFATEHDYLIAPNHVGHFVAASGHGEFGVPFQPRFPGGASLTAFERFVEEFFKTRSEPVVWPARSL
jgi:hypothetical protein